MDHQNLSSVRILSSIHHLSALTLDPGVSNDSALSYNIVSCVLAMQECDIDILPTTWEEVRQPIGQGGTATVHQSMFNLESSFAFKRLSDYQQKRGKGAGNYKNLISEIRILGTPAIRSHPNIVVLEGICWDITEQHIWPVLLFEKSYFGNLEEFAVSETGKSLSSSERLKLCGMIADAIKLLHREGLYKLSSGPIYAQFVSGIVHGDIKPNNVLVCKAIDGASIPKLADFGYSNLPNKEEYIRVAKSGPWAAPEHHDGEFLVAEGKEMDCFSFGMLCFWFLLHDKADFQDSVTNATNAMVTFRARSGYVADNAEHYLVSADLSDRGLKLRFFFQNALMEMPGRRHDAFEALDAATRSG